MTRDRRGRPIGELHAEAIVEPPRVPARVGRRERLGKVERLRRSPARVRERCREQVPGEIVGHVCPRLVVGESRELLVLEPRAEVVRASRRECGPAGWRGKGQIRPRGCRAGPFHVTSESLLLLAGHHRLGRLDAFDGLHHGRVPGVGRVAATQAAAKMRHRSDDVVDRDRFGSVPSRGTRSSGSPPAMSRRMHTTKSR